MARWLIYALGGGFGHLTRACALARATDVHTVRILTNSPYAGQVQSILPQLDIVAFDPAMTVAGARVAVVEEIAAAAPDCLIVDTFPRGLCGELADAISSPGLTVLVQRDLNPRYTAAFDLNTFIRNSYDVVIIPGEATEDGLGPFPQTEKTAPWLVRSAGELFSRDSARDWLDLREEKPCVIVCAAGNPEELNWYGTVVSHLLDAAPSCDVRCIAPVRPDACPPECWVSYWPAMDLYAAAEVVVGGAGYNTIYECVACDVPLIARPWPRKYDRQNLRASRAARIVDNPRGAAAAALELLPCVAATKRRTYFHNGATEAVALIEQLHPKRTRNITST